MRRLRETGGFTLIELMVVVMILAVLITVALPTFLGFRARAQNSAAQHSLTVAQKTTFVMALERNGFPGVDDMIAFLPITEPIFAWLEDTESSPDPGSVSIADGNGGTELAMAARSLSGTCFYLRISLGAGVARHSIDNAESCKAEDFREGNGAGW